MYPEEITAEMPESIVGTCTTSCFDELRSVKWRVNLGVLPSSVNSTIDDLRRVTANSRRRYASLRRRLLSDPHITKFGNDSPDLVTDNPLSQNPDSTWGRFFRNAELEKMVDTDLSRLYPEHGSYFHTQGCQGFLRRILLLWCLQHQECGYRQGMHELLAPLIYVLHADIQRLSEIRKLHEDHFVDKFDDALLNESLGYNFNISSKFLEDNNGFQEKSKEHSISTVLDANLQNFVLLSDPYGADGELGIVLSEKFMEHDAYSMFDALMSGSGGEVAMAKFFSHSPSTSQTGLPPVIEASLSLYHLLSIVDPSLYSHLIELGVEPQYFALRWLRVLFGREFSLEDLLVIWDEIFSFDNSKSIALEHDTAVSNSPRGVFISAMAVSMMLNVRSSLLAAELATSCLQRLLNFPEHVDLGKLIGKAKSLMPLALDANVSSHSAPFSGNHNHVKEMGVKAQTHRLSCDSSSLKAPVNVVPESYWEEKWRHLQNEEETKTGKFIQRASSTQKRGWAEKIKSKLSRTESDPSLSKRESQDRGKKPSSVRRSLLDDLSRHLQDEKDIEEDRNKRLSFLEDPLRVSPDPESPEHSPMFSEPTSPLEINSESSIVSNISNDMADGGTQNSSFQSTTADSPLPISYPIDSNACGVPSSDGSRSDLSVVGQKDRKSLSGKFQWLWKFVRHNSGEGSSVRKVDVEDGKSDDCATVQRNKTETSVSENRNFDDFARVQNKAETSISDNAAEKSDDFATLQENKSETSSEVDNGNSDESASVNRNETETSFSETGNFFTSVMNMDYGNLKTDGCDQSLVFALRNLGQSMLDNIQVVESAFGSERSQSGSREQTTSKHDLVEKGQVTVMTALNELRKISNLLQEV